MKFTRVSLFMINDHYTNLIVYRIVNPVVSICVKEKEKETVTFHFGRPKVPKQLDILNIFSDGRHSG